MTDYFNYHRRWSSIVSIGNTPLGGPFPIRLQSMAKVSTLDTDKAVSQAIRMIKAGAEIVRFTAQNEQEAHNLQHIREALLEQGYQTPLVADIHFNPKIADMAAAIVEKVRINPGNYFDSARKFENANVSDKAYLEELQKIRTRFVSFLNICREHNTAIRIGVNHGSLSDRIMNRYGDTPEGLVESCMEFLRICAEEQFDRVVVSIKASNTVVMIRAVRLLVRQMDAEGLSYPLHLGVTEAGDGEDGRIKSAVGIGALLVDGYGDTIRVSLSEEPEAEIPVARSLVDYISSLSSHPPIKSVVSPRYDPVWPIKRKSRAIAGIGGDNPPVALTHPFFPCFSVSEREAIKQCEAEAKFITLSYSDLTDDAIRLLKTDRHAIALVDSTHKHYIGEVRAFMHRLLEADCDVPVIFRREFDEPNSESVKIRAAVDFGTLFIDGFGDGLMMYPRKKSAFDSREIENIMLTILQAARVRISKTEYISCPGCGRTLFDLKKTITDVKAATSHLKGLKIGIMGCIVNGPGEMADADYGYVGAGRGRINLYQGKTCILKNIPEDEAVNQLLALISHSPCCQEITEQVRNDEYVNK